MALKLTKRTVDAATAKHRDTFLWDSEIKGLGLKVTPKWKKVFVFQYRLPSGPTRRLTIGPVGHLTTGQARGQAKSYAGLLAAGKDPADAKRAAKRDMTVAQLCKDYLENGVSAKKPSTVAIDRSCIERHIKPLVGTKPISRLRRIDIEQMRDAIATGKTAGDFKTKPRGRAIVKGGPTAADRAVASLRAILQFAVDNQTLTENPARRIRCLQKTKLERFLSAAEIGRLGEVLREFEENGGNSDAVAAIRALILTGCRKTEILSLKWNYIDFERVCLRLPDSKTGAKTVTLGAAALEHLAGLPRHENSPYVFPAARGNGHFVGLQKVWRKVREAAGLHDVRIHDLRHSFASIGAARGESLLVIGKLLNHRTQAVTQRYAHLSENPVRAAANEISGEIATALSGNSSKIIEFSATGSAS